VRAQFRDKSWSDVARAPVSAINGVSEADGVYLHRAFNINTILELTENKFVRVSQTMRARLRNVHSARKHPLLSPIFLLQPVLMLIATRKAVYHIKSDARARFFT
jgi:hypothetical protein